MTFANSANASYGSDRYKPKRLGYICHIDGPCMGETIGDFKILVDVAYPDIIELNDSIDNSRVMRTILDFKKNFIEFCKKEKSVHSFWLCVDHSTKNISIYTVIDDFDYSLEKRIYSGPFGDIVPLYEGYFIDLQIDILGDRKINEIIPEDCEIGYSRG